MYYISYQLTYIIIPVVYFNFNLYLLFYYTQNYTNSVHLQNFKEKFIIFAMQNDPVVTLY